MYAALRETAPGENTIRGNRPHAGETPPEKNIIRGKLETLPEKNIIRGKLQTRKHHKNMTTHALQFIGF